MFVPTHGGVQTDAAGAYTFTNLIPGDYYVVFTSDGTACYSDDAHEATLRTIDKYFGVVVPIAEVVEVWQRQRAQEVLPGLAAAGADA